MEVMIFAGLVVLLAALIRFPMKARKNYQKGFQKYDLYKPDERNPAFDANATSEAVHKREEMFLDIASKAAFKTKRILHDKEFALFTGILSASKTSWQLSKEVRVFPQVSLGEVISNVYNNQRSPKFNELAQAAINSKRCDIVITCYYGYPRVVVELQGRGHSENTKVVLRDKVKRLALASAGIALVEVQASEDNAAVLEKIRAALLSSYPNAFAKSSEHHSSG